MEYSVVYNSTNAKNSMHKHPPQMDGSRNINIVCSTNHLNIPIMQLRYFIKISSDMVLVNSVLNQIYRLGI